MDIETTTVYDFDYKKLNKIPLAKRKRGNQGTRRLVYYKNVVGAFDIETSRLEERDQAFMYLFTIALDGFPCVVGRTWEEFKYFCERVIPLLKHDEYIVLYVHNLAYEFQFLRGIYDFQEHEVFTVDKSRRVLKATMYDHIELRCSYFHSNTNLDEYLKSMNVEHKKAVGDLDYAKVRYPWTQLDDKELNYCCCDTVGLVEAIKAEMEHDGDTLYTIPLTSTGYVRRDAKEAMRGIDHKWLRNIQPNWHVFTMLRESFRGGNCHANRYLCARTLNGVYSYDERSAYPAVQISEKYPISKFQELGGVSFERVIKMINSDKALLMRVSIHDLRLQYRGWGFPYLSLSKCRNVKGVIIDNGRIVSAEYLETTITDIDLKIILREYDYSDLQVYDCCSSRYGLLPDALRSVTLSYFADKVLLEGVEGQEIAYSKAKSKLNSIYGMMAQNPVKQQIIYNGGNWCETDVPEEELLKQSNKKAFLAYQWGVWVTAHARARLERALEIAGDAGIYCDTDSVKSIGDIDYSSLNAEIESKSLETGAYVVDENGEPHIMGVFVNDGCYEEFSTLGAKKYCTRENGILKTTISGVTKALGGSELEEAGGIDAFRDGFIFRKAGGNEMLYNDEKEYEPLIVDGKEIKITTNVVIRPSIYTLGDEYKQLFRKGVLTNTLKALQDNGVLKCQ